MTPLVARALRLVLLAAPLLAAPAIAQGVAASPGAPDAGSPLLPAASVLADCSAPVVATQNSANLLLANDNRQELGQSFTAACTGTLDLFQFVYQSTPGTAGTTVAGIVTLFSGAGTAGPVLSTQPFSRVAPAEGAAAALAIPFTGLSVTGGDVYTVYVRMTSGSILLQAFNQNASGGPFADPYAGGTLFASTTGVANAAALAPYDLRFSVQFVPVSTAAGAGPAAGRLGAVSPNPAAGAARLELTADAAQTVRATVVDVRGREVGVAFEGPVAAGVATPISVDTAGLPAGVYVVRVVGSTLNEARRFTVVR